MPRRRIPTHDVALRRGLLGGHRRRHRVGYATFLCAGKAPRLREAASPDRHVRYTQSVDSSRAGHQLCFAVGLPTSTTHIDSLRVVARRSGSGFIHETPA